MSGWVSIMDMDYEATPFYLPEISSARVEKDEPLMNGRQVIVRFANGYAASIVNHSGAYGGLEVAVLNSRDALDYSTPITDDVVGYLDQESLIELLSKIHHLPAEAVS